MDFKALLQNRPYQKAAVDSETASFQLTAGQKQALDLLNSKSNIFLTGAAGTGKSELIKRFLMSNRCRFGTGGVFAVASTGAAAMLLRGSTFHRFFGLGLCSGELSDIVDKGAKSSSVIRRLRECTALVIDEISMLSGFVLEAAEQIARRVRKSELPWGGIKIIAVGDFAQLAPISNGKITDWAFLHPIWEWSDLTTVYLTEVVRTSDASYIEILGHVRKGNMNESVYSFLNTRPVPPDNFEGTRLYPRRAEVDAYNSRKLVGLPDKLHHIPTGFSGDSMYWKSLASSMQIPELLEIKAGAMIMLLRNDMAGRYFNGSLGIVEHIEDGNITVSLLSGDIVDVAHANFDYCDERGLVLATATNFPIKLAWASTIHKAQGISVDRISVSLTSLWEAGQAYVALSRSRSLGGLYVEAWDERSVIADTSVMEFYRQLGDKN